MASMNSNLENTDMQDILLKILKGISFDSGQSYFSLLTQQLTEVLKADYAIISELKDDKIARIQTLAVAAEGELIENFEYDLEHTPCANTISNSMCIHASGIQEIYPEDSFLEAKNIEAYAGICLLDADGNLYGIMNVLYRHPIENVNVVEFILKVLAVHTSAEIHRINIEKELLESERKNRAWLEKSPVCTKILDLDFNLQYMSSAGVQALNIDDITLHYGKPFPLEFHPESFKTTMTGNLKKALETHVVIEQEGPVIEVDGNELWFHSTIIPVLDDKGEDDYIMVLSQETTDRKQAEKKALQSQELLATFVKYTPAAVAMFDNDMCYIAHSNRWVTDYKLDCDDLRGQSHYEVFPNFTEETKEQWKAYHKQALSGEIIKLDNDYFTYLDGSKLWHRREYHPWYDTNDNIGGIIIFNEVTTESVMTEKSLQESEERFNLAMQGANDGLWDWNLKTDEVYYSPRWKSMLGYKNDEIKHFVSEWKRLLHPDDLDMVLANAEACINDEKKKYEIEFRVLHMDGHYVDILSRAFAVKDEEGEVIRLVGTHVDITERKQMEKQLNQSQKMEALGQLTGGIAHDFNNILTAVLGYSYMMEEHLQKQDDDTLNKYLAHIIKGGVRAQKLVEDMLLFGRKGSTETEVVSVNTVVQDAVNLLKGSLPSSMAIHVTSEDDDITVLIDPIQLEQVIMNLAINARDAMHEVGELTIGVMSLSIADGTKGIPSSLSDNTSERMDVCFCQNENAHIHSGDFVELSVRDTGSGMSKEILTHIFEPFYTNKDVGKGTGMGLAMVHGIMDNVSGHIIIETEEAKGTLFRLLFKSSEKIEADGLITALVDDIPANDASGCILLVDDEVALLDYMTILLTTSGYEVITCGDGEAALTLFQKTPNEFDLVITDQTMPKLTGAELSKELIKIRPDIPIILTTGYSETIDKAQAEAIGIRSYLEKPAMPDLILKTINDLLSKVA